MRAQDPRNSSFVLLVSFEPVASGGPSQSFRMMGERIGVVVIREPTSRRDLRSYYNESRIFFLRFLLNEGRAPKFAYVPWAQGDIEQLTSVVARAIWEFYPGCKVILTDPPGSGRERPRSMTMFSMKGERKSCPCISLSPELGAEALLDWLQGKTVTRPPNELSGVSGGKVRLTSLGGWPE